MIMKKIIKSWVTNPRGSKDSYRKKTMKKIKKEGDGGSFGNGGGTVFTSANSGIFTPTYSERGAVKHQKRKKKTSGIERLGDFVNDNSPQKKMSKADSNMKPLVDLIKWVTLELRKDDTKRFRQQTSGETINEQIPRIDWKKDKEENNELTTYENPVEFEAEPDDKSDLKQNDETNRIKTLDDNKKKDDEEPKDAGNASLTAPGGLNVQLAMPSAGIEYDALHQGGAKDLKRGKVRAEEKKENSIFKNVLKRLEKIISTE